MKSERNLALERYGERGRTALVMVVVDGAMLMRAAGM